MRHTAFDILGRPTERRAERQLIAEYLATVEELAQSLSDGKLDTAVALASLPDDTRSFGHVKEVNMQKTAGVAGLISQRRAECCCLTPAAAEQFPVPGSSASGLAVVGFAKARRSLASSTPPL
ncbi:DUF6537 domain-containing protein [Cupriavidus necator]|uniref:DUF6537 domain-containing protein n=1 Tax=Cupriavidus necator TaxID=106590 RepID=UPI0038B33191